MEISCRFTEDRHFTIGIFYQGVSFGGDGLGGVERALTKRDLELAAEGIPDGDPEGWDV